MSKQKKEDRAQFHAREWMRLFRDCNLRGLSQDVLQRAQDEGILDRVMEILEGAPDE